MSDGLSVGVEEQFSASVIHDLEKRIQVLEQSRQDFENAQNRLNLVVFESHRDRLLAAFVIANGAAACGMEVTMFFTFWATPALRKGGKQFGKKSLVERAFGFLLPKSLDSTKLSQMEMLGVGRKLLTREMKKKSIADLNELLQTAAYLGVRIQVCDMSMRLMGIRPEELVDYPNMEFCGVASFSEKAANANTTMFI